MPEKSCRTCKETKPLSAFHKQQSSRDGYKDQCRACCRVEFKDWYDNRRDKEHDKARKDVWWQENREEGLVKKKADKASDEGAFRTHKSNARNRGIVSTLTLDEFIEMRKCHDCPCCGRKLLIGAPRKGPNLLHDQTWSIDRIDSSGIYEKSNCRAICLRCNSLRSNISAEEFRLCAEGIIRDFERRRKPTGPIQLDLFQ